MMSSLICSYLYLLLPLLVPTEGLGTPIKLGEGESHGELEASVGGRKSESPSASTSFSIFSFSSSVSTGLSMKSSLLTFLLTRTRGSGEVMSASDCEEHMSLDPQATIHYKQS